MKTLMLGNEAVARGAYEAGCTVAAAYPGTPSTEITENIAKYSEIYSEWSPNEKVALEVAIGASLAGARAICSMKHVGLNVAADPLFTVSYTGINGGLVIVVADDPGMHSSQNEQDTRHYARAAKVPMLEPSDSMECKEYVKLAFEISENFDTPVIVRLSTRIAHSRSIVETNERFGYQLKDYVKDIRKYVMIPSNARSRHIEVEKRVAELREYSESSPVNQMQMNSGEIGVLTSGISYQYAKEALGEDISYQKLGMVFPLPERQIREFAQKVKKLYIIEELDPYLEDYVHALGIEATGKGILPLTGEYNKRLIKECVNGKSDDESQSASSDLPVRPPVMCPGCPHRGVFYIFNKLKLNVIGDIGCYSLGALPPAEAMDTCVCMGAGVGMAHGMEKARGRDFAARTVAVIGDSTFIHSGITGIIDIAYNGGTSTVIVLDNSITGMTGHQNNPASGFNIKGDPATRVSIENVAAAVGFKRIRIVDPFDLDKVEKTLKEELNADEPSLIIARRPCALLKGVEFGGPLRIIPEKCRSCNACMRLGCPAITKTGDKIYINESLCVGCMLCVKVCRFDAIGKIGKDGAAND